MAKEEYVLGSQQKGPPPGPGSGPPGGGERAKDFKTAMKKILIYAKKDLGLMGLAVIFAMAGACLTLVGPSQLSRITDEIRDGMMTEINLAEIQAIGTVVVVLYAFSYVLSLSQGFIMTAMIQKVAKNLRKDISRKIHHLPMAYFSSHSKGDVLSRVTNDVDTIGQALTQSFGTFVSSVTLLLGSLVMMCFTNQILAGTALCSVMFGFVFMVLVMKNAQVFFQNQQKYLGAINGHIEEMYAGHTVLKAYNGEAEALAVFHQINGQLKTSAFRAQALSGLMMPVMQFIGNFAYVTVCIVGAILALQGSITFGVIVAFMVYVRLFTQPLGQLAQAMQQLQSASAAAERVFEFLEEEEMPEESEKTKTLGQVKGAVEFKGVNFGYTPEKTVIHSFSAQVQPGQKIAIVGPTGAGKTTIVNLLMRFFEVDSGQIFIDGTSSQEVKRGEVQTQFSMVLQDTWIFQGTLRENLQYSKEDVSQKQLEEAVAAVGLTHFVRTLEKGFDTQLGGNLELSQGQKQQITIARAMIADKPMLILDEATSSIDTRTELLIQRAMDELMASRTSFVIAHRLSTIKDADMILVLKDGDIIETGNHQELLAQEGFYAELYHAQFESANSGNAD